MRTVGASVGHGEKAGDRVLLGEVLVLELLAVDGLATPAVAHGEVTTLEHELLDDAVEAAALVVERLAAAAGSLLSGAKSTEVLGSAGGGVGVQLLHIRRAGNENEG